MENAPAPAAAFYRAALQLKLLVNGVVALVLFSFAPGIANLVFSNPEIAPLLRWVSLGVLGASLYNYMVARVQAGGEISRCTLFYGQGDNVGKLLVLGGIALLDIFTPDSVLAAWIAAFLSWLPALAIAMGGNTPQCQRRRGLSWMSGTGDSCSSSANGWWLRLFPVQSVFACRHAGTGALCGRGRYRPVRGGLEYHLHRRIS
ncbi:MAG: hypothetical protein U5K56_17030 [Halioglobus sp.]|nr:hypothetical protein [Halioglobus sp.]